ncbi:MAG: hypothetical protein HYX46_07590 [Betaproteobacteria bacterium]|nr:hypothetical protein [Betaproteobacteria bacterium]
MTALDTSRDNQAWELMQSAHRFVEAGEWPRAAAALEQAAAIHKEAGRDYDQARCLQLAASLRRSAGDPARARLLIERAAAAAPEDLPLAVSIATERAEAASLEGRHPDAVRLWDEAIAKARQAEAKPENLSALLRRRAKSRLALHELQPAAADFDEAAALLDPRLAAFVRTEQAELLLRDGHAEEAARTLDGIDTSGDAHLRAEALVLRARAARTSGRFAEALDFAADARDAALEAVAPVSYFAAALELAASFEAQGDVVNCYGTLATAWATLGDVLGQGVASSWVEPVLLTYQVKWGNDAFAATRQEYEARRRAAKPEAPNE